MFERNRIDNAPTTTAVPVAIAFADGAQEKGRMYVPLGRSLADCLNAPSLFLEFEPYGGERSFIAKAQIVSLKLMGVPKTPHLDAGASNRNDFDPHTVLGVSPAAEWPEIRSAYVERAKTYHPDKYSNADLPQEVQSYLAAIARRINMAYEVLEDAHNASKVVKAAKTAPIYTSRATA